MTRDEGEPVSSGTVNAGSSFDLRAAATAAESAYAGIVRLVEEAQHSKAPFVRLADRYALDLRPVHAGHLRGGLGPVRRPRSRAGGPGRGDAVPAPAGRADRDRRWDLPGGAPRRDRQGRRAARSAGAGSGHPVRQDRDPDRRPAEAGHVDVGPATEPGAIDQGEVLRLAASVEQLSPHVLAGSIVHGARDRGLVAVDAGRCRRDAGRRRGRHGRRPGGRGRDSGVLRRRGRTARLGTRRPSPGRDRWVDLCLRPDRRGRSRRTGDGRPAPPRDPTGDPLPPADRVHADRRWSPATTRRSPTSSDRPSASTRSWPIGCRPRRSMPSAPSGRTPPGRS